MKVTLTAAKPCQPALDTCLPLVCGQNPNPCRPWVAGGIIRPWTITDCVKYNTAPSQHIGVSTYTLLLLGDSRFELLAQSLFHFFEIQSILKSQKSNSERAYIQAERFLSTYAFRYQQFFMQANWYLISRYALLSC